MAAEDTWQFIGTEETLGVLCDVFLVSTDNESKISTLYFYQSQPRISEGIMGQTVRTPPTRSARCIARIMVSTQSFDVLLNALAANKGLELKAKEAEE